MPELIEETVIRNGRKFVRRFTPETIQKRKENMLRASLISRINRIEARESQKTDAPLMRWHRDHYELVRKI